MAQHFNDLHTDRVNVDGDCEMVTKEVERKGQRD